jgi:hypothetical protein
LLTLLTLLTLSSLALKRLGGALGLPSTDCVSQELLGYCPYSRSTTSTSTTHADTAAATAVINRVGDVGGVGDGGSGDGGGGRCVDVGESLFVPGVIHYLNRTTHTHENGTEQFSYTLNGFGRGDLTTVVISSDMVYDHLLTRYSCGLEQALLASLTPDTTDTAIRTCIDTVIDARMDTSTDTSTLVGRLNLRPHPLLPWNKHYQSAALNLAGTV